MKKQLIIIGSALLLACSAGAQNNSCFTKASAEVNRYEGIAVFTDSSPDLPYDVLGDVMVHSSGGLGVGNDHYEAKRDAAVKKAKKEYPEAEGVIITFKGNGACTAEAIKFKN